ncbi:MAG: YdjY domain-containing protein [Syntrophobacteraceae bacterium]|nr:YdjY domain-containing protein [Syntrophobacteraceae bacterium]
MNKTKTFWLGVVLGLVASCLFAGDLHAKGDVEKTLSPQNPLVVDKESGTVSFLAEVNGKYFFDSTRHAAVFKGGTNGDKGVFIGLVTPKAFYSALLEVGAKPGENMTPENKEKTVVKGDLLDVTVTWKGAKKNYTLDQVITDSNHKPIQVRFGGNMARALKKNTGCLICLDSCPVGICSNASYTYGAVETRGQVRFTGNKDVLPPDGTRVVISVKVKR